MSGSVPGGKKVEPNLTPMLDMVFQLITFFMLVLNFKAAELDLSLMLPVIGSAKPLPQGEKLKLIVLNVQTVTKCPKCNALAYLVRDKDDSGKVIGHHLHCERGHDTPVDESAISHGKVALNLYGRLLTKEKRDENHESITDYLVSEREDSRKKLTPPLTVDEIVHEGKQLPDIVCVRADAMCPSGAVNYIINEAQKQGYWEFALKTGKPAEASRP